MMDCSDVCEVISRLFREFFGLVKRPFDELLNEGVFKKEVDGMKIAIQCYSKPVWKVVLTSIYSVSF